jgi:ubiquinone/menaquinone biosynthesis C-methylase UbiE
VETRETIDGSVMRLSMDVTHNPSRAFELLVEELVLALEQLGIDFQPGADGRILEGDIEVGRVLSWKAGEQVVLRWLPADWDPEVFTEVELSFETSGAGARVALEHRGWGRSIGVSEELVGWFAGQAAAPLLRAMAPAALGDWLTDRQARRPSGAQARGIYADPLYHYPNFRVILEELALKPDDYLLEVGCGGGALLRQALESGCRAAAVDHSQEMVALALQSNRDTVAEGRLEIRLASAVRLPFADATFTCAAMTGVLGFLRDPVAALSEIRRVLVSGGRFVLLGSDPELKGTPGAPEPMLSRLSFYGDEELKKLGFDAGFHEVGVIQRNLEAFAREAGVPEEHLAFFGEPGTRFLIGRKE